MRMHSLARPITPGPGGLPAYQHAPRTPLPDIIFRPLRDGMFLATANLYIARNEFFQRTCRLDICSVQRLLESYLEDPEKTLQLFFNWESPSADGPAESQALLDL
jgi:hypothetical protein